MQDLFTKTVEIDDNLALDWSISLRKKMIDRATNGGNNLPEDIKEAGLVVKMIDGIDKISLGRMKMQTDSDNTKQMSEVALALAGMDNYFTALGMASPEVVEDKDIPKDANLDDNKIPSFEFTEDEKKVGVSNMTYKDFENKMLNGED